jgi:outer membrane protein assembly factor BamB
LLGLLSAPAARALDATSANSLASAVLTQLGRSKGVCAIPNCGNGQLALAFLNNSGMKVHAMDPDTAHVRAASQLVDAAGFIAPRFYVDKGTLSLMPYTARFVDCIVITNLTDAALTNVSYSEIERVLDPNGMAWIGRATSEGSGITQAALQSWINAATRSLSTAVISTSNGTWAVITRKDVSGTDVWSRHGYDSQASRYSKDSVAAFPWLPQYKLKPYAANAPQTVVTSGGRMYTAIAERTSLPPVPAENCLLRAYNIFNGELLWVRNLTNDNVGDYGGDPIAAYGNDVYLLRASGGILQLNGLTGAEIGVVSSLPEPPLSTATKPTIGTSGCGPNDASINATYDGTGVYGWDFIANRQRTNHYIKPSCRVLGIVVSNGFTLIGPPSCSCGGKYRGFHVESAAGSFQFDRDATSTGAERLEQGPTYGAISVQVRPDSLDWPTYRSTTAHSGGSLANVAATAAQANLMWNRRPAVNYVTAPTARCFDYLPEQEPTAPVTAGTYTYFGGTDCFVRCIDNTSGRLKWSYRTGGRIYGAPTVWDGCVYVGSGDGYAYCIEAHSGSLVWRFRAAPVDMRMNLWGYLSSIWPVLASVVVYNGNAYFVAGMESEYGTHVYCVNAKTGALVWQNNRSANCMRPDERMGYSPTGGLCIAGTKLVGTNNINHIVSFDLATGVKDPLPSWLAGSGYANGSANTTQPWCATQCRDIGVVNNAYIFTGGQLTFQDHAMRENAGTHEVITGYNKFEANVIKYPKICFNWTTNTTPAWDKSDIFTCMKGSSRLTRFAIGDFCTKLDAKGSSMLASDPNSNCNADADIVGDLTTTKPWWPTTVWTRNDIWINAIALAPNALVAAYTKVQPNVAENQDWYVGALDRNTGTTMWETKLPDVGTNLRGEPLWQGLAIDRNGYIIVAQRNGNMVCYGNGVTSVATPSVEMPAATDRPASLTSTTSWNDQRSDSEPQRTSASQDVSVSSASVHAAVEGAALSPTVQLSSPLAAAPETQAHASLLDTSDMITFADGHRGHAYPPDIRAEMVASAVGEPGDMTWHPEHVCLPVASVKASSQARGTTAAATTDRSLTSRWTPAKTGSQWIEYDLGRVREVSSVSLVWFALRRGETLLKVEVSSDGKQYEVVDCGVLQGRGTKESLRTFPAYAARYVRVSLNTTSPEAQASLLEVGIHGGDQQTSQR